MIRLNVFIQVSEENRPAALETAKELVEKRLSRPAARLARALQARHPGGTA